MRGSKEAFLLRRRLELVAALPLALLAACASAPVPRTHSPVPGARAARAPDAASLQAQAAGEAEAQLGVSYRWGGDSQNGFDCSGLVVYSYAAAGLPGLPHSAAALERRARPVPLGALEPGDLLFFDLAGRQAAHVAIYLGDGAFVHAPSSGKSVERVPMDHPWWSRRLRRAGRLVP